MLPVTMGGEKMSKSLGNIFLVNDLLKKYPGETLRLSLISSHYRQPLNWNSKIIEQAQKNLDRIYRILKDNENISIDENIHVPDNVVDALSDDLNTSKAMFEINLIADKLSKSNNKNKSALKGELVSSGKILGLFQQSPSEWLKYGKTNNNIDSNFIEELILKSIIMLTGLFIYIFEFISRKYIFIGSKIFGSWLVVIGIISCLTSIIY